MHLITSDHASDIYKLKSINSIPNSSLPQDKSLTLYLNVTNLFSYTNLISFILSTPTFASLANTRNDLHIIPETQESNEELDKKVKDIAKNPGKVLETYNNKADELAQKGDLGSAFATGIFNRDLILLYIAYLVQFLSQLGMLI